MSTEQLQLHQDSLALTVACGRSVRGWARRHDVKYDTVYQWSIQHEFREIVEVARLRIADRMVGCLMRGAQVAIAELIKLCTRCASPAIRLSASRTLVTFWMEMHDHFDQAGTIRGMKQELADLKKERKTGEWRPNKPYERNYPPTPRSSK
jgi:hypothetical protein